MIHAEAPPAPPVEAEAALGAMAARFHRTDRVSLADIRDATGLSLPRAVRLRVWAAAVGRWPYARPMAGQSRRRPVP